MIISRKKYEKLNCDLVRAKAKVDDAKRVVDSENKLIKAMLVTKQERDKYKNQNEQLKRKAQAYDKMMTGEMGELYKKAEAFDGVKQYALSKNKDFEDRKDTARSNKEFNYFNILQIANRAIINKCKQLEDE